MQENKDLSVFTLFVLAHIAILQYFAIYCKILLFLLIQVRNSNKILIRSRILQYLAINIDGPLEARPAGLGKMRSNADVPLGVMAMD